MTATTPAIGIRGWEVERLANRMTAEALFEDERPDYLPEPDPIRADVLRDLMETGTGYEVTSVAGVIEYVDLDKPMCYLVEPEKATSEDWHRAAEYLAAKAARLRDQAEQELAFAFYALGRANAAAREANLA